MADLKSKLTSTEQALLKTQESFATESNELSPGQRGVEYLTGHKSRLEVNITDFDLKLASTEQMEGCYQRIKETHASLTGSLQQARISSRSCSRGSPLPFLT